METAGGGRACTGRTRATMALLAARCPAPRRTLPAPRAHVNNLAFAAARLSACTSCGHKPVSVLKRAIRRPSRGMAACQATPQVAWAAAGRRCAPPTCRPAAEPGGWAACRYHCVLYLKGVSFGSSCGICLRLSALPTSPRSIMRAGRQLRGHQLGRAVAERSAGRHENDRVA